VFDWGWADAYERAGGRYYPKLQIAVPFTPVTGPRLLSPPGPERPPAAVNWPPGPPSFASGSTPLRCTSPFSPPDEAADLDQTGWLRRTDTQFHWHNQGYGQFSDFLAALSSRKRKNIRKERAAVSAAGIEFEWLTGSDIKEHHWDTFFAFYIDTGSRKWGSPYLTRAFFSLIGETMASRVLLVFARRRAGDRGRVEPDRLRCALRPLLGRGRTP
jgi:uncharacterized protein